MKLRKPSSRWALWVFAAALLLKSAMPWLASASAQMQGKTLVEVCSVYGVSLVPLSGQSDDATHLPAPDHASHHGTGHCALSAFAALAGTDRGVPVPLPLPVGDASPRHAHPSSQAPDACATWVARLKHGPPILA
ncbi:MAG: hypothetical protein ACSLE9_04180 [Burkholderiaceae bacterium]